MHVEIDCTGTLVVFVRRPSEGHRNWWLGFYSTDPTETLKWNIAIQDTCKKLSYTAFQQGTWKHDHQDRHPKCTDSDLSNCPGVLQVWEIWIGCSDWGLHFPDATLEDIRHCGDKALDSILEDVFPMAQARVAQMTW